MIYDVKVADNNALNPYKDADKNSLTKENVWYKQAANSVYNAMNQEGGKVSESTVYGILMKLENRDDWKELVSPLYDEEITVSVSGSYINL